MKNSEELLCPRKLHKGWWEMCTGVSTHSLRTWGKHMSLGMERQEQGHQDCQMEEMLPFQKGSLFWKISGTSSEHTIIFLFFSLADVNQVQSTQSRVSVNTVNNGKETLSKGQQSFIWVVSISQLKCLRCFANLWGFCFTPEGDDGPAEGYCATS